MDWIDRQQQEMEPYLQYVEPYGHTGPQKRSMEDLHATAPRVVESDWDPTRTRSTDFGNVTTHFGDLTDPLIDFIRGSRAIAGCVAWLTEPRILKALQYVHCAIIVQKEDFLRPDMGATDRWKEDLRANYGRLGNGIQRHQYPFPLSMASYLEGLDMDPVRCVGNHNADRSMSMPRMHHKFLVRVEPSQVGEDESGFFSSGPVQASAVWTGSFNFSKNAGRSFENAVEIHDPEVAETYLKEFARVAMLSEPLNWQFPWVTPEFRLGS